MPDDFCTSSLQSDVLFAGEGMSQEGYLHCDALCSGSEFCREPSIKKQKGKIDLWKEALHDQNHGDDTTVLKDHLI